MTIQHNIFTHLQEGWVRHKKRILITAGTTGFVVLVVVGGSFAYVKTFEGKNYPNVSIGGVDVGGMTQGEASEAVQAAYNSMLDRGLPVRFEDEERKELSVIDLRVGGSTDPDLVYDLIDANVDKATQEAFLMGRARGNSFLDTITAFGLLVEQKNIEPEITVATVQIKNAILEKFGDVEETGEKTTFDIEATRDGYTIEVVVGTPGEELNVDDVVAKLKDDVADFTLEEYQLRLVTARDVITEEEAATLFDAVTAALESAPYTLTYTAETQREYTWEADEDDLMQWLAPMRKEDGSVELGFDVTKMETFLDDIKADTDVAPQNARFQVEGARVVEFAGSLNGVSFDADTTLHALASELGNEDVELAIVVETVEPDITTESVNSLGITEIVGVGTSNFGGSPANRVANIQHGANKLNGLLIAPGEEFSLVSTLKPFTVEDGWLPELVIKGDEIKPEVGGGACQFGTTLFRAAMHTGLEITQRRNHSLIVSYYNDPQNGNPGTDATIYDPAPDFRFRNDMEHHLLLTTEVNLTTKDMIFTFWGTSDGRQGSYTPPQVLSRTGYGATVTKETETLPQGVRQCQAAYSGAVTSFDYNVEYADGTTFTHTYTSTYRSLPQVCLVGIGGASSEPAPIPEPAEDPEGEEEEA